MTINIEISCDARGCCNAREIEDYTDGDVASIGWHSDPTYEGQHYCPVCWPKIEKELADV